MKLLRFQPWQQTLAILALVLLCAAFFIWSGLPQVGVPSH
jgi:hypothetical protein